MALTQVSTNGIADGAVTADDLENSGVTAGTYGSSSAIPAITVDAKGRVTSASTSSIDSTAITNGTSNVSVAASGDITATRAGTQRLAVTSTGVNVTGSVTCNAASPQVVLQDNDNTGVGAVGSIVSQDSGGSSKWLVGDFSTANENLYLYNYASADLILSVNNGGKQISLTSAGHWVPADDDAQDLGTSTTQWRNGYFDGTVYCDGIEIDNAIIGTAVATTLRFTESSTTVGLVSSASFGFHDGVGIAIGSQNNEPMKFGTNGVLRAQFSNAGHFVPNGGNTYDLGDSSNRWRNVYTNDLNLSNEGSSNDVDGTWGSWTIQEGEEDLFLLNRRNGKKYKFNLSEVN